MRDGDELVFGDKNIFMILEHWLEEEITVLVQCAVSSVLNSLYLSMYHMGKLKQK